MRISDWSSDVCSSDLVPAHFQQIDDLLIALVRSNFTAIACIAHLDLPLLCLEGDEPGIETDAVEESVRINPDVANLRHRSEEHTSELQSLMRISYAVFCLKKKKNNTQIKTRKKVQLR